MNFPELCLLVLSRMSERPPGTLGGEKEGKKTGKKKKDSGCLPPLKYSLLDDMKPNNRYVLANKCDHM